MKEYYPTFFAAMRRATTSLGYTTKEQQDAYYTRVLNEEAHCSSVKQLASEEAFKACLRRFDADAKNNARRFDTEFEKQKRRAYIVKVMCCQLMQLKGVDEKHARAYLNGVLKQARPSAGSFSDGEEFWLDLSAGSLLLAIRILDSHLRKLKRLHFPTYPTDFSDRVKYVKSGRIFIIENVPKYYYANLPFRVRF